MRPMNEIKLSRLLSTPIRGWRFRDRDFGTFSHGIVERLSLRSDLHLARKIWHMSMGMVIALLYEAGVPTGVGIILLSMALVFTVVIETLRLRHSGWNEKMIRIFRPVMRSNEVDRCTGIPFYLASSLFAIAAFPKPVAVMSIMFLACGDPMASLVGILYGERSLRFPNGKSLLGTLAGIATCAVVALVYLQAHSFRPGAVLALSMVGGLAGGLAEWVPVEVDDNFTIPVVSGMVMWFAFILLGF